MKTKILFTFLAIVFALFPYHHVWAQISPIACNGGCVYPGDVDNNGVVNMNDLLPIGVAYGATGLIRNTEALSSDFIGTSADNWEQTFAGIDFDYRYVDCTGNGIINASDAYVVQNNYGLTHPLNGQTLVIPTIAGNYNLYLDMEDTTVTLNDTVNINLRLGNPADSYSVYGLAFSMVFNAEDANTFEIDFPQSFINSDTNIVAIYRRISNTQIDVALTRIDHQTAVGNGVFGRIKFVMEDIIDSGKNKTTALANLHINIENIQVLTSGTILQQIENVQSNFIEQAVQVPAAVVTVNQQNPILRIYPNPATNFMQVQLPNNIPINSLQVFNLNGQIVYQNYLPTNNNSNNNSNYAMIDVQNLSSGVYVLQVVTNQTVVSQRFVVIK